MEEDNNNALVSSMTEAETEKNVLQDLHEKLQLKQQNYEREKKDQTDMMGKLLEEVENTSLLAARDGDRLEASKLDNMEKEKCIREIFSSQLLMMSLMEEDCFFIKSLAGAGTRLGESDEEKLKTLCIKDSNAWRERMGLTVADSDALRKGMDTLVQRK